ncbi:hypothetical protein C8Q73DRAFT_392421 [Cubamyces lactineus]|nr:hypothetical protein C8Q73DRAFT_392421 [Cubamyces lactineus]
MRRGAITQQYKRTQLTQLNRFVMRRASAGALLSIHRATIYATTAPLSRASIWANSGHLWSWFDSCILAKGNEFFISHTLIPSLRVSPLRKASLTLTLELLPSTTSTSEYSVGALSHAPWPLALMLFDNPYSRMCSTCRNAASNIVTTRPTTGCTQRETGADRVPGRSPHMAQIPAALDCAVGLQEGYTTCGSEEIFDTENVAEALRVKQRMRARQALRSIITSPTASVNRGHLESASCASSSSPSSPASTPPSTPPLHPTDLVFPTRKRSKYFFNIPVKSRGRSGSTSSSGSEDWDIRPKSPSQMISQGKPRPSMSRSSVICRSLSRHSSRSSIVSPSPISVSNSPAILNLLDQLAPLPRFNPYQRSRAESLTSIKDSAVRDINGATLSRRRCKSQPEANTGLPRRQ